MQNNTHTYVQAVYGLEWKTLRTGMHISYAGHHRRTQCTHASSNYRWVGGGGDVHGDSVGDGDGDGAPPVVHGAVESTEGISEIWVRETFSGFAKLGVSQIWGKGKFYLWLRVHPEFIRNPALVQF